MVDFAGDTSRLHGHPGERAAPDRHAAAGHARVLRLDRAVPERAVDLQVPRRLGQDLDVDVHRAGRPQLAPTCWPNATPANASTPANAADVLAIRAMAQTQYSNIGGAESLWVDHTVNRGERPRSRPAARHDRRTTRRPLVPGQRHRRHRRRQRRPGHDVRPGGREHVLPLHAGPRRRPRRRHGDRLHEVERDDEPADQVRGPARRRPAQHAQPGRADADRRHRRAERQLRALGLHPLGRLQRHGARPERLRVLDDRRVLRDDRPQPPDPDRLVPLPGLHARSATARSRARSPTARTRSPARPSALGSRTTTTNGSGHVLVHRPGRDVSDR